MAPDPGHLRLEPAEIDYTEYGINDAIVIDNTGVWRDEEGLGQHLQARALQGYLTAPGKGNLKNIVYGVNTDDITAEDTICRLLPVPPTRLPRS